MFWILIGVLIGVGFFLLITRSKAKLAWFDWAFLLLAVLFGLLAVQNYMASLEELEPKAATLLLLAFGVPAVLFAAIVAVRTLRKPALKA